MVLLLNPIVNPPYTSDPAEVDTRCISGDRAICVSKRLPAAPTPSKAAPSTPRLKAFLAARGNVIIQLDPPPLPSWEEEFVLEVLLRLTAMSPVSRYVGIHVKQGKTSAVRRRSAEFSALHPGGVVSSSRKLADGQGVTVLSPVVFDCKGDGQWLFLLTIPPQVIHRCLISLLFCVRGV